MNSGIDSRRAPSFRRALLRWYDVNKRDLPWRNTRDPYRIWISEIMLQQTRVAAVLSRYERFLGKFPSVNELASANVDTVLAEWSGLGYYHRARNLHLAARDIVREHGSAFPTSADGLRRLPGIGRYTSAAIASIAYNEALAVLDGNVERVLRRLVGVSSKAESWNAAQKLLDRVRPGDFNQAMMELGATVCVPAAPLCAKCPVKRFCFTRGRGEAPRAKPRQRKASVCYGLSVRRSCVLLVRRPLQHRLMPGMWELPRIHRATSHDLLFTVRHSITVTNYKVTVLCCPEVCVNGGKWVKTTRLPELPLTGLAKKILRKAKIIE